MKHKKFTIRKQPVQPKKSDFKGRMQSTEINNNISANVLIAVLQDAVAEDPDAYLESEVSYEDCYYESDLPSCVMSLKLHGETHFYRKAMKEYQEKLATYNQWREKYKHEIAEELNLRDLEK